MPRPTRRSPSSSLSSPSVVVRARPLLAPPMAAELAVAAAADRPSLVILVVDDEGLLVAVRDLDLGPAELADACLTFVTLASIRGRAAAVVAFVDPGGGAEPASAAEAAWHEARRRLEAHEVTLLDWLLVAGDEVASVPSRFGEATPW